MYRVRIILQLNEEEFSSWIEHKEITLSEELGASFPPNEIITSIRTRVLVPIHGLWFIKSCRIKAKDNGIHVDDFVAQCGRDNPFYVVVRCQQNRPYSALKCILPILEREDGLAFVRRIKETPDDNAPRKIYADWLDEQADNLPIGDGCIPALRWRAEWFRETPDEEAKISPVTDVLPYFNLHYGEDRTVSGRFLLFFSQMLALGFTVEETENRFGDTPFLSVAPEHWFSHFVFQNKGGLQFPLSADKTKLVAPLCGKTLPVLYNLRESKRTSISKVLRVNPFRYQIPFSDLSNEIRPLIGRVFANQQNTDSLYFLAEHLLPSAFPPIQESRVRELYDFLNNEEHSYKPPRWARTFIQQVVNRQLTEMNVTNYSGQIRCFRNFEDGLKFLDKVSKIILPESQI